MIIAAVVLFAFGMAFLAAHYGVNTAIDQMLLTIQINETPEVVTTLTATKDLTSRFDYVLFGLFIGLMLAVMISGWFIGGNPFFMFIYFGIVSVAVVVSAVLANGWETMSQSATFAATVGSFPITNHLLNFLPLYIGIMGFIGIVAMFAKPVLRPGE